MPEPSNNHPSLTGPQLGTMFPSLDGSVPGDQEASSDISGQILDALNPKNDLQSQIAQGSTLQTPATEGAPAEATSEQVAAGEINAPQARRKRSAEDRIAVLTRKFRQEQEGRNLVEEQLARLTEIVENQNTQLQNLRNTPTPRPSAAASSDPSGLGGLLEGATPPPTPSASVPANDIAALVQSALEAHDQKRTALEQRNRGVMAQQEASFELACEEMPELRDARTSAHRTFMQIYRASPIASLPDGPYQIALQVRGILADESRQPAANPAATDQRKRQVSTIVPKPTTTDAPNASRAQIQKALDEVSQRMKNGDSNIETYVLWRKLRSGLQRTQ